MKDILQDLKYMVQLLSSDVADLLMYVSQHNTTCQGLLERQQLWWVASFKYKVISLSYLPAQPPIIL